MRTGRPPLLDWGRLDWRKQNIALARENGVSEQAVFYQRRIRKQPRPANWHQHQGAKERQAKRMAKWRRWDWSLTNIAIARLKGYTREYIRQIRKLIQAQPPIRDGDYAYQMGFDCGKNGANITNCDPSVFSSPANTRRWENGKKDAERSNAPDQRPPT